METYFNFFFFLNTFQIISCPPYIFKEERSLGFFKKNPLFIITLHYKFKLKHDFAILLSGKKGKKTPFI